MLLQLVLIATRGQQRLYTSLKHRQHTVKVTVCNVEVRGMRTLTRGKAANSLE